MEQRERQKAKHRDVVVVRRDASWMVWRKAEEDAEKAWERSGRTASWGCRWFEVWKENVHKAVALGQTLKVVFFPGQVGMGRADWDLLSRAPLWDGEGCEDDQKIQIAYLERMQEQNPGKGWEYDSVDIIDFLKKHFQPGKRVLARDAYQWRRGTLLSYPMLVESTKRFWTKTAGCQVECLETKEVFSADECVLLPDGTERDTGDNDTIA